MRVRCISLSFRAAQAAVLVLAGLGPGLSGPVQAQGLVESLVRQPTPATSLSEALIRLNRNPRDTEALTAAGNAALATGDTDAAVGFFTRALRLAPDNPQVEAGLAGAKVRAEDPFSAIPLFIAADKSVAAGKGGPISPELLGDRGLAYDLIGDNANAQQYYRQALAVSPLTGPAAEISRRLALSLAIGGDRRASETVLSTLLQKQDRAAWRARIFALAILGYEEEAVSTARSTMPPELALEIAPYLRYMRRLTAAQQAAAANLGHFPQASEIGHDDPRVAQYAHTLDRSQLGAADQALVPAGAPLGRPGSMASAGETASASRNRRRDTAPQAGLTAPAVRPVAGNTAPPELIASRETQPAAPSALTNVAPPPIVSVPRPLSSVPPPVRLATSAPSSTPQPSIQRPAMQPTVAVPVIQPLPRPATIPPPVRLAYGPPRSAQADGEALPNSALAPSSTPAPTMAAVPTMAAAPAAVPPPTARTSFNDAFAAMSPATVDITPERGAVDLRKIKPARAQPPAPPPPPPPAHPSRIWVELGVGRDPDRLDFDWRRMVKADPEIFHGKKPFVSGYARTNRLLVGPFETDKAADAFVERLHRADPSAFVWTSPAGQVVDPLDDS